jgi:hypothetical protein
MSKLSMSRITLNRIIRLLLAIVAAATGVLMVAAARPPLRYFGNIPAQVGEREQITTTWDVPGVYVTVIDPAVVSFESIDPEIRDAICAAVKIERGEAPGALEFDDYLPQAEWDKPPQDAVVFRWDDFRGTSRNGTVLRIENDVIAAPMLSLEDYAVSWLNPGNLILYDGDAVGGLVCYRFTIPGENDTLIPPVHSLVFNARNIHVTGRPEYFFRYETPLQGGDPPGTLVLVRFPVETYLERVAQSAPFAVKEN